MKRIAAIVVACVVLALGLSMALKSSGDADPPASQDSSPQVARPVAISRHTPAPAADGEPALEPDARDETSVTTEQFRQLSHEDQDKAIEAFVAAFWTSEAGDAHPVTTQEQFLTLDIFARPYLTTVAESEYFQLSPQDQERVMAETTESCRQMRTHVKGLVAQAEADMAGNDYRRAEACLISGLEIGRELCANPDGMFITRVVGISIQKDALNNMATLYTQTGEHARLQAIQAELRDLEAEMDEMRAAAEQ